MSRFDKMVGDDKEAKVAKRKSTAITVVVATVVLAIVAAVAVYAINANKPQEEVVFEAEKEETDVIETAKPAIEQEEKTEDDKVAASTQTSDSFTYIDSDIAMPADADSYVNAAAGLENHEALTPNELTQVLAGVSCAYKWEGKAVDEESNKKAQEAVNTYLEKYSKALDVIAENGEEPYLYDYYEYCRQRVDVQSAFVDVIMSRLIDATELNGGAGCDVYSAIYKLGLYMNDVAEGKTTDTVVTYLSKSGIDKYDEKMMEIDDTCRMIHLDSSIMAYDLRNAYDVMGAVKLTNSYDFWTFREDGSAIDKTQAVYVVPVIQANEDASNTFRTYAAFLDENFDVVSVTSYNACAYQYDWSMYNK